MTNYNTATMAGISEQDYETLVLHLGEQVTAALIADGFDRDEAPKAAQDALANTWQDDMTARDWLDAVGKRLNVNTSGCVGA